MIDSRMTAVMNFVRAGSRVADIGADHGYLSIELVKSLRESKVIATEKNLKPFAAAQKNISAAGLENLIEIRLGDGLKVLSAGEVDTICIAGMGGALIEKILSDAPDVVQAAERLILQPMNAAEKIRAWTARNGWKIADEDLAEDGGIIYEIICVEKNPPEKIFKRSSSPLEKKFLAQRLKKLQRILNEMSKSSAARASEKFFATRVEIESLRKKIESLEELDAWLNEGEYKSEEKFYYRPNEIRVVDSQEEYEQIMAQCIKERIWGLSAEEIRTFFEITSRKMPDYRKILEGDKNE